MVNDSPESVFLQLTGLVLENIQLLLQALYFFLQLKYLLTIVLLLLQHTGLEHLHHLLMVFDNHIFRRVFFLSVLVVVQYLPFQFVPLLLSLLQLL